MADIDLILARLRTAAATRGQEWLQAQVAPLLLDEAGGSGGGGEATPRARRSRPPERFSPGPSSRTARPNRSPGTDPSAPPAKRVAAVTPGGTGRNPPQRRSAGGGASGRYGARASPPRRQDSSRTVPPTAQASARGEIRRGRSRGTAGGQLPDAAGSPHAARISREPVEDRRRGPGASRGDSSVGQQSTAAGGRKERGRTATRWESTAPRQASPGRLLTPMLQATEVRSEGELSGSDEDVRQDIAPSGGSSAAAMGSRPSQPGLLCMMIISVSSGTVYVQSGSDITDCNMKCPEDDVIVELYRECGGEDRTLLENLCSFNATKSHDSRVRLHTGSGCWKLTHARKDDSCVYKIWCYDIPEYLISSTEIRVLDPVLISNLTSTGGRLYEEMAVRVQFSGEESTVTWEVDGEPLPERYRLIDDNRMLIIPSVQRDDAKRRFRVRITNPVSEEIREYRLEIRDLNSHSGRPGLNVGVLVVAVMISISNI